MQDGWFQLPTSVRFGAGVAAELADQVARLGGRRVLVVTDPGVRAAGIADALIADLRAAFDVELTDAISGNPRDHECLAATDLARCHAADTIVAIGGGSPMDAAKAVAALVTNGGTVQDWEAPRRLDRAPLPIVAVPTTAGTGSEVTFYAVVTDTARQFKMSLFDTRLAPRVALVDPEMTASVPTAVAAATGMDALTHAVEAYTGRLASPVTDALALHAIRLISRHLEAAVLDRAAADAREAMMMASLIAGMAFGNADVAAVHCLAEAIGGRYDTPHGVANSVFLPVVFAYNAETDPARHADVAVALGIPVEGRDAGELAQAGAARLRELARRIGIPAFSALADIDPVEFPALAEAAAANVSNASNSRAMDASSYLDLLQRAWNDH